MAVSVATKHWTLEELDSLPDDGNTYEVIHGELFVTPAPTYDHETIAARLHRILEPYVERNGLGLIFRPKAVIQRSDSQVEPDLQVCQPQANRKATWRTAPVPSLVVEILSPSTKRRDREHKRRFYMELGVTEYWIVDPEQETVAVIKADRPDVTSGETITWSPAGASQSLTLDVAVLFG
mgnify:CR=1 FL=1